MIVWVLLLLAAAAAGLLGYMVAEAYRYRLDKQFISLERLPASFDGTRLLFISDIHRRTIPDHVIEACVNDGGADLVLIGGDLREKGVPLSRIRANLRKLAAAAPVYFVYGNHDHDEDLRPFEVMMAEERIRLLVNESVVLEQRDGARIRLSGVDDPRTERDRLDLALSEPEDGDRLCTLLLAHDPLIASRMDKRTQVDLVLCGHNHGGQIVLPLLGPLLRTTSLKHFGRGWYKLPKRKTAEATTPLLFVSCGFGTSKLPLRLNAPPELHLFTLRPAPRQDQDRS